MKCSVVFQGFFPTKILVSAGISSMSIITVYYVIRHKLTYLQIGRLILIAHSSLAIVCLIYSSNLKAMLYLVSKRGQKFNVRVFSFENSSDFVRK